MNTIKKIFIALAVALVAVGAAEAKPVAFGVKAGLNVNKLNHKLSENTCGWTAGVMADFTVPIVGLGADVSLMYSRMNNGNDIPVIDLSNGNVSEANLYGKNFLVLPINLKYKFTIPVVSNFLKPYVFTGPSFAFRLDKSVTVEDVKSRSCQVDWNVGLGLELINHVQVGASYGFGINNIVKYTGDYVNPTKIKNNCWTVTAAYLF